MTEQHHDHAGPKMATTTIARGQRAYSSETTKALDKCWPQAEGCELGKNKLTDPSRGQGFVFLQTISGPVALLLPWTARA